MVTTVTVNQYESVDEPRVDLTPQAFTTLNEAPALEIAEPITLDQAKAHLRVVVADDDAYIYSLILAARQMAEGRLNRTIVQRRRVALFHAWNTVFPLLKPPVISVDNIGYIDETGGEMLMDPGLFFLADAGEEEIPVAELNLGDEPLPDLLRGRRNAVRVYYTAGYPVGQVPQPIIQWMLLAIGTLYANREAEVVGATVYALPDDFMKWLLKPYQVYE